MKFQLDASNPLRRPGYRLFFLMMMIRTMGGGFHFIAGYWLLYGHTASPKAMAWLAIAFWLPSALVMPIGGVIVDRWSRRKILACLDAYLCLNTLALVVVLLTRPFEPWYLYLYGALSSPAYALGFSAQTAWLQQVLSKKELLHANSINTALAQGGYLCGAGAAGLLLPYVTIPGAFGIDAMAVALSSVGWILLGRWFPESGAEKASDEESGQGIFSQYMAGLKSIGAAPLVFLFALFMIIPRLSAQTINVLQVGFSKDILGKGSVGFGLMDMAYGAGAMCCGLMFPMVIRKMGLRLGLVTLGLIWTGLGFLAMSYAPNLGLSMLALVAVGVGSGMVGILATTHLQQSTDNKVMGRTMSSVQLCQYLMIPTAIWLLGSYADREEGEGAFQLLHDSGLRDGFVAVALLFFLIAVVSRPVVRLQRKHEE